MWRFSLSIRLECSLGIIIILVVILGLGNAVKFLVYLGLKKCRLSSLVLPWLLLASLFFYAFWEAVYLKLILGSIVVNYAVAVSIVRRPLYRKAALVVGVAFNLSLLCRLVPRRIRCKSSLKMFPILI